jgi:hypothetical protein
MYDDLNLSFRITSEKYIHAHIRCTQLHQPYVCPPKFVMSLKYVDIGNGGKAIEFCLMDENISNQKYLVESPAAPAWSSGSPSPTAYRPTELIFEPQPNAKS